MRKRIVTRNTESHMPPDRPWLDLVGLAQAELTSEDPSHPIESALGPEGGPGWRAAEPGRQTIRLLFDKPLHVRHVRVVFEENEQARTQEFVLRWSPDGGRSYREIVRQQYNFSLPGAACEREDYVVDLAGLTALELEIVPDIGGGSARASVTQLRLA